MEELLSYRVPPDFRDRLDQQATNDSSSPLHPRYRGTPPDFPAGGWRVRELAQGIHYTIVNGQVLLEDGQHTGALPGRVLRNTLYHETATA